MEEEGQQRFNSTEQLGSELRDKFLEFLEEFTVSDAAAAAGVPAPEGGEAQQQFYVQQVHQMKQAEKTTLFVDFGHVESHDWDLADTIATQFLRVETYLRKVRTSLRAFLCMHACWRGRSCVRPS